MEEKAKTAIKADVFDEDEIHSLKHGLHDARYDEVRNKANQLKPETGKIPGFIDRYTKLTEHPWNGHPVKDLENDLENGNTHIQALALQRYYPVEKGRTGNAPSLYKGFLSHENSDVAATALRMMNEHPVLRGDSKEYTRVLEKFLDSGN